MVNDETMKILCRLGITANYAGFHYTAYAVALAVEDPLRLQLATKWLYPDVAAKYNTTSDHVRKNIAKICTRAWERNPKLLSELAMYELKEKPGTSEFLAIVTVHISFNIHTDAPYATPRQSE